MTTSGNECRNRAVGRARVGEPQPTVPIVVRWGYRRALAAGGSLYAGNGGAGKQREIGLRPQRTKEEAMRKKYTAPKMARRIVKISQFVGASPANGDPVPETSDFSKA